ncbi:MAG: tRNA (N(6)-L-threonylcarbamoyladenosine(37)-C(2))-methylthiotransferase MtaB [Opitutales bacterium]|nr:tRNA (N(6)-L-threonylcarbamoyladenosine(37)-C(2))-methylthiotransferase MtaB [Opitutales bacterium]
MQIENSEKRRARIHTLGCRLNQAESRILEDQLVASGYTLVRSEEAADLVIIHTCTVTLEAEAKCRKAIRQAIRAQPKAFIAVIGCYSQTGAKAIAAIPGVDLIIGNEDKMNVLLHARGGKNPHPVILRDRISRDDFRIETVGDRPFPKRANLKVQDGCDFVCSFCIIPFARGRARSRDWENLLEEARSAVQRGVRELILTGVNIGTFRQGARDVVDVVDALHELPGIDRVRISSIEPTTVPEGLLDRMADPDHALMPYLHLPLQSGSDPVLTAMRRRYTRAEYAEFVSIAVDRVPDLCLGTDILVGSPEEDADAFIETVEFFEEQPFTYAHVFPYSERPGTLAVKKGGFASMEERQRRVQILRRRSAIKLRKFQAAHLGQELEVLLEDPREGRWPGLTRNYVRVVVDGPPNLDLRNRLARVRLDQIAADYVEGTLMEWDSGVSKSHFRNAPKGCAALA